MIWKSGQRVYINGAPYIVVRQVLFNRPAYRVAARQRMAGEAPDRVVDGFYLSNNPRNRVGFVQQESQVAHPYLEHDDLPGCEPVVFPEVA